MEVCGHSHVPAHLSFTPHWIGDWVGLSAGLNFVEKRTLPLSGVETRFFWHTAPIPFKPMTWGRNCLFVFIFPFFLLFSSSICFHLRLFVFSSSPFSCPFFMFFFPTCFFFFVSSVLSPNSPLCLFPWPFYSFPALFSSLYFLQFFCYFSSLISYFYFFPFFIYFFISSSSPPPLHSFCLSFSVSSPVQSRVQSLKW